MYLFLLLLITSVNAELSLLGCTPGDIKPSSLKAMFAAFKTTRNGPLEDQQILARTYKSCICGHRGKCYHLEYTSPYLADPPTTGDTDQESTTLKPLPTTTASFLETTSDQTLNETEIPDKHEITRRLLIAEKEDSIIPDPFDSEDHKAYQELYHKQILDRLDELKEMETNRSRSYERIMEHSQASCPSLIPHNVICEATMDKTLVQEIVKNSTESLSLALRSCEGNRKTLIGEVATLSTQIERNTAASEGHSIAEQLQLAELETCTMDLNAYKGREKTLRTVSSSIISKSGYLYRMAKQLLEYVNTTEPEASKVVKQVTKDLKTIRMSFHDWHRRSFEIAHWSAGIFRIMFRGESNLTVKMGRLAEMVEDNCGPGYTRHQISKYIGMGCQKLLDSKPPLCVIKMLMGHICELYGEKIELGNDW